MCVYIYIYIYRRAVLPVRRGAPRGAGERRLRVGREGRAQPAAASIIVIYLSFLLL